MADNKIVIEVGVTGNADVSVNKLTTAMDAFGERAKVAFEKGHGAYEVFEGSLAARAAEKGFELLKEAAEKLFDVFVSEGVKAAIQTENAIGQLNSALVASNKFSLEASHGLVEFAESMQRSTKFSNDQVLQSEALIQSLGRLNREGLEKATTAALDMAAALGIDLHTASLLVGKAAEGNISTLGRYGLKVEEGATKSETFANALQKINDRFGGSAARQAETFSGAIAILSHNFEDAQKEVGFAIIQNQSLVNVIRELAKMADELGDGIKKNKVALSDFVSNGVVYAIEGSKYLVIGLETLYSSFLQVERGARLAQVGLSYVASAFSAEAGQRARDGAKAIDEIDKSLRKLDSGKSAFDSMIDGLQRLKVVAEAGFGKTVDQAAALAKSYRAGASEAAELSKAQQKLIDEGIQLVEQAVKKDPEKNYQRETRALRAALEAQKITYQQYYDSLEIFRKEHDQKISEAVYKQAEVIIETNRALSQDISIQNNRRIIDNQAALAVILQNENLSAKDRAKIQLAYAEQSKLIEQGRKQAISDSLGALSTLQTAKTKEIAIIGKAAAIAQTTIDTYRGATSAAASLAGIPIVGPALAAAAAAAFIAAGLFRVAQISGVNLRTGLTEVPAGYPNDTFRANLTSGERVVDAGTNQDLKQFLATSSQLLPLMAAMARGGGGRSPVIVQVGTKTIVDEVSEGLRSGRVINA